MDRSISRLDRWLLVLHWLRSIVGIVPVQAQEMCGGETYPFPYTDVSGVGAAFCPGIMEAYVTGVSKGTTPTTFSPDENVSRIQMTTFLQRSLDQGLTRTSRRAALEQWSTPQNTNSMQTISIGGAPSSCAADGENIWVTTGGGESVNLAQVQESDGNVLNSTGFLGTPFGVVVVAGQVFITDFIPSGLVYSFSATNLNRPTGETGFVPNPRGITFDGTNIWTANSGPPGGVSILSPQLPPTFPTVTTGFQSPWGIIYDGTNIWVTDNLAGKLFKLNSSGGIIQTVTVGGGPAFPVFDGTNIWVPNLNDSSITVVQASTGNIVATITSDASNQLNGPIRASFDGQRILVTNTIGGTVTLFNAADLSFIANISTGSDSFPFIACSDGINFWIPLAGSGRLLRF